MALLTGDEKTMNTMWDPLGSIASTVINKAGEAAGEWIKEKINPTKTQKYQIDVNGNYSDIAIKNKK